MGTEPYPLAGAAQAGGGEEHGEDDAIHRQRLFSLVDIQVYTVLWFFAYAFPHPPQRILEELKGRVP